MAKNKSWQQTNPAPKLEGDTYSDRTEEIEKEPAPKIIIDHEDSELDTNWLDISTAPKDGNVIVVAEVLTDDGVLSYWKKTRKLVKMRWHVAGKWMRYTTNMGLGFEPKYWRAK